MKKLLEDAARRSIRYRLQIEERDVAPDSKSIAALAAWIFGPLFAHWVAAASRH